MENFKQLVVTAINNHIECESIKSAMTPDKMNNVHKVVIQNIRDSILTTPIQEVHLVFMIVVPDLTLEELTLENLDLIEAEIVELLK